MKFENKISLEEILEQTGAIAVGTTSQPIAGINEIHKVEPGDITYVDHPKYYDKSLGSDATYILIDREVDVPEDKILLVVDSPFDAYNGIVKKYFPFEASKSSIHPSAVIDPTVILQPGVFVGPGVRIGARTILHAGVSLQASVHIGEDCIVHSNTVIGSDAYYYHSDADDECIYTKMVSCGRVIIEDQVEIGSLCSIDRGVSGDTRIGRGTKIDNHVHIAHGVVIGTNCLIAAQVGIAGKTIIGNDVKLWGQVGVSKSLHIGDGAEVYAQSGVPSDLEGGQKYFGSPAEVAKIKMKEQVWIKRIEEINGKLEELQKKLDI